MIGAAPSGVHDNTARPPAGQGIPAAFSKLRDACAYGTELGRKHSVPMVLDQASLMLDFQAGLSQSPPPRGPRLAGLGRTIGT